MLNLNIFSFSFDRNNFWGSEWHCNTRRYKKYEEEVRIKKEENRVSEEAFLADVHGLKPGTEWERVARNCGFNSKVVHCKKDRARMRNVILSLKQETLLNRN